MEEAHVQVQITRWIDDSSYPLIVECRLIDAWGAEWLFIEKEPVVSLAALDQHGTYPQPGVIACQVLKRWQAEDGREICTIDTEMPWDVRAQNDETRFDVLVSQLVIE